MRLQFAVFQGYNGPLLADWSTIAQNAEWSTNEHGYEGCSATIPMSVVEAFRWYDRTGLLVLRVSCGAQTVWEGRIEDVAIVPDGIRVGAFGAWRGFGDVPVTALWSTTEVAAWTPLRKEDQPNGYAYPNRFGFDTDNRIFIGANNGSIQGNSPIIAGYIRYQIPAGSSRQIVAISFDYLLSVPSASWQVGVSRDTGTNSFWSFTAPSAGSFTGTQTLTCAATNELTVYLHYAAGNATVTQQNGEIFVRLLNVRVKTISSAVDPSEIVKHFLAQTRLINPEHLNPSTAFIQAPGLDLRDKAYEDAYGSEVLPRLARLGDTQNRRWEVGVYEQQMVYFRPRASAGRAWYVDVEGVELERSLDGLWNSGYAVLQDANGTTIRGSVTTDAASAQRFGVVRQAAISSQTSNASQAATELATALADSKDLQPRSGMPVKRVYDQYGAEWPLWMVRSGDSVTIRNLPPILSSSIDKIRTFRIGATAYKDGSEDALLVQPDEPLPALETLALRRGEGY